jgi:hypothetical protein
MNRITIPFILLLLFSLNAEAQRLNHVQGELLIQLKKNNTTRQLTSTFSSKQLPFKLEYSKAISSDMDIHSFKFDFARFNENEVLAYVRSMPEVEIAQFNHIVQLRSTIPDDPLFNNQWQYINTGQLSGGVEDADLDIELAWDNTTGGLTKSGDTIVVCVIDDGLHPDHMDFGDNLWFNHAEIPDNDIDDDNNGYLDDYQGWNTADNNDDIDQENWHGTPVAGIIGAKGNNGMGVAGVNWTVKLMIVYGGTGVESEVLQAYGYPLSFRKKYNETNGQEGAFVVATNASWGVDQAFPEDAPLWCAMYDSLGKYGILNCGATSNSFINVDQQGDLPTSCPSDYLISVTNIGPDDQFQNSGYGVTTIDLGAYGAETYTVATPNDYEDFGGTSGSCPHVTGTIGLLYSADCDALNLLVKSDPAEAALLVKEAILESTTPNNSLEGRTVTEGRLNVNEAMNYLLLNCGPCPNVSSISINDITTDGATVSWLENDSTLEVDLRYKIDGSDWLEVNDVSSPYALNMTGPCASVEFQLISYCNSDTSGYSRSFFFKVDGCCDVPLNFQSDVVETTTARLIWDDVTAAGQYKIGLRENGQTNTENFTVSGNEIVLSDLNPCTEYLVTIQSICADSSSDQSEALLFKTFGCGVCLDADYCEARGTDTEFEWIGTFSLDTFTNESGQEGYGDFTGMDLPVLETKKTYSTSIFPGDSPNLGQEYYRMWIDFNQDGEFDGDEMLIDTITEGDLGIESMFTVPDSAEIGNTRIRIAIRFLDAPSNCNSNFHFGEYEDYCVTIDENSSVIDRGSENQLIKLYPNPASEFIIIDNVGGDPLEYLEVFALSGKSALSVEVTNAENKERIDVSSLPSGIYLLKGKSRDGKWFSRKIVIL